MQARTRNFNDIPKSVKVRLQYSRPRADRQQPLMASKPWVLRCFLPIPCVALVFCNRSVDYLWHHVTLSLRDALTLDGSLVLLLQRLTSRDCLRRHSLSYMRSSLKSGYSLSCNAWCVMFDTLCVQSFTSREVRYSGHDVRRYDS